MGDLGVSNVNRDYIVNYDTGEIISVEAIYMGNVENHTIQDLINSELDASVTVVNGEYDSEKETKQNLKSEIIHSRHPIISVYKIMFRARCRIK